MKFYHQFLFLFAIGMFLFAGSNNAFAQKIRYVDTDKVLAGYAGAQDVQKELDVIKQKYETEFQAKQASLQRLVEEIQNQSLLLSPEKKAAKEQEAQLMQKDLEQYYYQKLGPQGEWYKKQQELAQPLYDKIQEVIKKVGEDEGYDFILDTVQGVVLYANPAHNITEQIIEELGKIK